MKISVLSPDLSHNCLGRTYLIAQLLERNFNVEVIGPKLGDGIWEPMKSEYDYKSIDMKATIFDFALNYSSLSHKISGDVIYATKPRMTSFGLSLIHKLGDEKPLILDIDDWESGFIYDKSSRPFYSYIKAIPRMVDVNSLNYMRILEMASDCADAITVSNHFLQNKFGGSLVPHVRNTEVFSPQRFNKKALREELGIPENKCIVLFSGTPRPHKGVEDLIQATKSLQRTDIVPLVVGAHDSPYVRKLRSIADETAIFRGQQPFNQIPKWIAASDIFVIPQRRSYSTEGQLPAKVFDAMAMSKPIIATNVSDLPVILKNCGIIVEPDSPNKLAKAIRELAENPQKRESLGRNARQKCVDDYSYEALAPKVSAIVRELC